jgi:multidrug efflux pump subunit AcrA (membrane-fusion protein)
MMAMGMTGMTKRPRHAAVALIHGLVALTLAAGRPVAADDGEPVLERCLVSLIEEAKIPAREPGVLVELPLREGDTLAKGDEIARVDDDQPRMEKRRAQAEHDQAVAKSESDVDVRFSVASLKVAQAELDKALEASRRVPGSVTEVEINRLRLNVEKSDLQIEQANLEQRVSKLAAVSKGVEVEAADHSIQRRLITSPIDGVVVQVFPHLGEWMQPGDPLARVVRTDRLRVEGYVDAAKWDPDQVRDRPVTVEVALAGERRETFTGRIVFVSPLVESGGDYRVFAEIDNRKVAASQQWILRAGQTATMTVHSRQEPLPAVRRETTAAR